MKLDQYANITDISANVANSSTDINASVILVSVMDFTDVLMLKIWLILADTDTDINIGASLLVTNISVCYILCFFIKLTLYTYIRRLLICSFIIQLYSLLYKN